MQFVIILTAALCLIATVASGFWFAATRKRKQLVLGGLFLVATAILSGAAVMHIKGTHYLRGLLARQGTSVSAPDQRHASQGT